MFGGLWIEQSWMEKDLAATLLVDTCVATSKVWFKWRWLFIMSPLETMWERARYSSAPCAIWKAPTNRFPILISSNCAPEPRIGFGIYQASDHGRRIRRSLRASARRKAHVVSGFTFGLFQPAISPD